MIFRYQNPPPPSCDWLTISFPRANTIEIVDAPSSDLTDALVAEYTSSHLLKSHELEPTRLTFRFYGRPWYACAFSEKSVQSRILLLKLLEILEKFGYKFFASVDGVNGFDKADMILVTRQQGRTPGMPVSHR